MTECIIYDTIKTEHFDKWMMSLEGTTRARVVDRLDRLECGNFGDVIVLEHGVSELRVHFGAGLRVYFMKQGARIVVLLGGGTKRTQKRDIKKAYKLAKLITGGRQI